MANPNKHITVFDFYTDDLSTLDADTTKEVGYKVKASDIWSISISEHELKRLHVTLTVIYWSEEKVINRNNPYSLAP
jgi:hypothetical protein